MLSMDGARPGTASSFTFLVDVQDTEAQRKRARLPSYVIPKQHFAGM